MDLTDITDRVDSCFDEMVGILGDLVRIPSVSAPGYPAEEVRRSAETIVELLRAEGMADARVLEIDGAHPAVFGEVAGPEGAPTVLLYAHHDVQPPGPAEKWETAPFEPFQRDGRIFGRGSSDDISGVVMHLATLRAFAGDPPVTIKVFMEGEEEVGSAHAGAYLDAYGDLLAADVIVIADAGIWKVGTPGLTTSLRGLVSCEVRVTTGRNPLHSGMFGGVVPDAISALVRLLATLQDDSGEVAIEGLVSSDDVAAELGPEYVTSVLDGPPGLSEIGSGPVAARLWTKPSISILALDAPPLAEAINQLVPTAAAKVSLRIAPGQDVDDAARRLRQHLLDNAPWGVDVEVTGLEAGPPFRLDREGPVADAFWSAMAETWGTEPVEMGAGGSIPLVAMLDDRFPDAAILLTGAGDPTSAIHAPNESQDIGELRRAIIAQVSALARLA